jgi:hypothetical protein
VLSAAIQLPPPCPLIRGALDDVWRSGYKVSSLSVNPDNCHCDNLAGAPVNVAPPFRARQHHLRLQKLRRVAGCDRLDNADETDPASLEVQTASTLVKYNAVTFPVPWPYKPERCTMLESSLGLGRARGILLGIVMMWSCIMMLLLPQAAFWISHSFSGLRSMTT